MSSKNLIAELEHELVSTAKLLDRVPADKLNWQPHPKAMTLGQLAHHVATIPGRYLTFASEGNTSLEILTQHPSPKDKDEISDSFKTSCTQAKELLKNTGENWENKSWNLTKNGSVIFTLPIPLFTRLLVFNHLFHHRGQLSTYLRTLNIPLPSIYGPSADENPFA
ncbi:MAG: DinB family protein [Bacteroidota bacterium]|nr:DinB family protein [Bacteroidota bacterium]